MLLRALMVLVWKKNVARWLKILVIILFPSRSIRVTLVASISRTFSVVTRTHRRLMFSLRLVRFGAILFLKSLFSRLMRTLVFCRSLLNGPFWSRRKRVLVVPLQQVVPSSLSFIRTRLRMLFLRRYKLVRRKIRSSSPFSMVRLLTGRYLVRLLFFVMKRCQVMKFMLSRRMLVL